MHFSLFNARRVPKTPSQELKTPAGTEKTEPGTENTAAREPKTHLGAKNTEGTENTNAGRKNTAGTKNTNPETKNPEPLTKCCACHEICTSRFTKCCTCDKICAKCCTCHEICTSRFCQVLHLPRNLHFEELYLSRNLHFEVHQVLYLSRNLHFEVHKVLRLPRNLHIEGHRVLVQKSRFIAPVTKSELLDDHHHVRSAAPATKTAFRSKTAPIPCTCHEKSTVKHRNTRFPLRLPRKGITVCENAHVATTRAQSLEAPATATQTLRSCAVEMRSDDVERHECTVNSSESAAHARGLQRSKHQLPFTYRKNPSVCPHCLGKINFCYPCKTLFLKLETASALMHALKSQGLRTLLLDRRNQRRTTATPF